jgi:hypothetical protein
MRVVVRFFMPVLPALRRQISNSDRAFFRQDCVRNQAL